MTGSRHFEDRAKVERELELRRAAQGRTLIVVVGDCPTGVDLFVRQWCTTHSVPCAVWDAEWERFGPAAGPRRNRRMVDAYGDIKECLAFFQPGAANRGTTDCARYAAKRGIRVTAFYPPEGLW